MIKASRMIFKSNLPLGEKNIRAGERWLRKRSLWGNIINFCCTFNSLGDFDET